MSEVAELQARDARIARDPDLVHWVPDADLGNRIARCGFDCSGRTPKPEAIPNCVVCIDLHEHNR